MRISMLVGSNHQNVKPRVDAPFNGGVLFKFKVSIGIPLFEGDIDVITLGECIQQMEHYFSMKKSSIENKLSFTTLNFTSNPLCWW
jgi:hypothetical protein